MRGGVCGRNRCCHGSHRTYQCATAASHCATCCAQPTGVLDPGAPCHYASAFSPIAALRRVATAASPRLSCSATIHCAPSRGAEVGSDGMFFSLLLQKLAAVISPTTTLGPAASIHPASALRQRASLPMRSTSAGSNSSRNCASLPAHSVRLCAHALCLRGSLLLPAVTSYRPITVFRPPARSSPPPHSAP